MSVIQQAEKSCYTRETTKDNHAFRAYEMKTLCSQIKAVNKAVSFQKLMLFRQRVKYLCITMTPSWATELLREIKVMTQEKWPQC